MKLISPRKQKKEDWVPNIEIGSVVTGSYKSRVVDVRCVLPSLEIQNEISILTKADNHQNIVRYYSSKQKHNKFFYCLGTSIGNISALFFFLN